MTVGRMNLSLADARFSRPSLPGGTVLVFAGTFLVMVVAWAALALIYSGIGTSGTSVMESRAVLSAVTSTEARSGPVEVRAILATEQFFALGDRSNEFFALAPEENVLVELEAPGFFNVLDQSADALAIDPSRYIPVLLTLNVHEGETPDPGEWLAGVSMGALDTAEGAVAPLSDYRTVFRSEHHQTVAVQFPREAATAATDDNGSGVLALRVPAEGEPEALVVTWALPDAYDVSALDSDRGLVAPIIAVAAVIAGLLVVFSPCAVHMTAYFLPLVTGLGMKEVLDRSGDVRFRAHVGSLGIAFVAGFVVLYTVFGVIAGFAGQLFSDTERLETFVTPVRIATGSIVIFMALQTLGVFRMPFVMSLQLPGRPHDATPRRGYIAAAISGMTISVGCLTCVGGSLLASLLLYSGAAGSPVMGGLTLFLFSVGMSIPFLAAAFAFERVLPRFTRARTVLRYSTAAAAAVMLFVGLLIISGNDSIVEQLVA